MTTMTTATQERGVTDLNRLLNAAQLPALPQSALRLLELSRDPENGPIEFAAPIEADPGLAGQVLKFVNSSYFGFSNEISNVRMAITLVGVRTIKNFALWSAVFSLTPNPKCGPFELKSLWQDSLRRGLFARAAAKLFGLKEAEEAFSAALLQDMAIPLLAKQLPKQYEQILSDRCERHRRMSEIEREQFGWDHAEAAGQLARIWKMPEGFADLLERHTQLGELNSARPLDIAQFAVALSALLPSVSDTNWWDGERLEAEYDKARAGKGPKLVDLLDQVDQEFTEFAPVLKLATPTTPLAAWYARPEVEG
jgi:HD-like signal output (HDOD) protein